MYAVLGERCIHVQLDFRWRFQDTYCAYSCRLATEKLSAVNDITLIEQGS